MFSLRCLAAERRLQEAAGLRRAGKKSEGSGRDGCTMSQAREEGREGMKEDAIEKKEREGRRS